MGEKLPTLKEFMQISQEVIKNLDVVAHAEYILSLQRSLQGKLYNDARPKSKKATIYAD